MSDDEAQVRAIALEDNRRAARQCRHLATDLRRARTAWRTVVEVLPQDEKGQDRPDMLIYDVDVARTFNSAHRFTEMVEALEERAACFDAAAERVSRAIDRPRAGERP